MTGWMPQRLDRSSQILQARVPDVDHKSFLLLLAYIPGRNKSQARQAIFMAEGKELHMGRDVLPLTAELCRKKLIESTNYSGRGDFYRTTELGERAIEKRYERFRLISYIS